MRVNKTQKLILTIGLLLMALAALFPPRGYHGSDIYAARGFLYQWDVGGNPQSISLEKLVVEWMFLAAATACAVVCAKSVPEREQSI